MAQLRRQGMAVLWFLFVAALAVVVAFWIASIGLPCGDNEVCAGPPSLHHTLIYLALGAVFVLVGATAQRRWHTMYGTFFWMVGVVLLVHGALITIQSPH